MQNVRVNVSFPRAACAEVTNKIRRDPAEREKFLKDPGAYLQTHGIVVESDALPTKQNIQSMLGTSFEATDQARVMVAV
jgi:hypothetical protein